MAFPPPTSNQAKIIWISLTGLAIALIIGLAVALVWGLGEVLHFLSPVVWPVAISGIIAYLLDPVVDFLERKRVPRGRAIILVFVVFTLLAALVVASIAPRVVQQAGDLFSNLPSYARQVQKFADHWVDKLPQSIKQRLLPSPEPATLSETNAQGASPVTGNTNGLAAPLLTTNSTSSGTNAAVVAGNLTLRDLLHGDLVEKAILWGASLLPEIGSWIGKRLSQVASWVGTILGLALVPVFTYYFLHEKKGIQEGWTRYLPVTESRFKDELVFCLKSINNYLIVFFRGQVLIAIIDGALFCMGFSILGLNYALLVGVMAGALSIVPYLGTILTIVPATILAAVQFGDWLHPLLVIGIFSLVQTVEGFFISPKIMGDRVGLHPLTIIMAVLVGTTLLGGILGGILAIPVTAALRVIMFRYIWKTPEEVAGAGT